MSTENETTPEAGPATANEEPTKAELQRRMEKTREDLAQSVDEIKKVVERQYDAVKETATGVLDYREHFKEEPLVWSLGALSAGFALGYTLGYAHINIKGPGRKHSQVAAFADNIKRELSNVGQSLVMPALSTQIKELFGFDFSKLLEEIGSTKRGGATRTGAKASGKKKVAKKRVSRKKLSTKKRSSDVSVKTTRRKR